MNRERAALVLGYLKARDGEERPDRLSCSALLAAYELSREGRVDNLFFPLRDLSELQKQRVRTMFSGLPPREIIAEEVARTTRGELRAFKEKSRQKGWGEMTVIGNDSHIPRIKREAREIFGDDPIEILGTREVLSQYPRYTRFLEEMKHWPEQRSFVMQEKLFNVPIVGKIVGVEHPKVQKFALSVRNCLFSGVEKFFD